MADQPISINFGATKQKISHRLLADLAAMLEPDTQESARGWVPRPNQLPPPGDWQVWLIRAGRGWGKTKTAAEFVVSEVRRGARRIHVIGQTAGDVRDVMIEGPSGLIACSPPGFRPRYESSKRRLVWPNGAQAITFTAEKPQQLRGPECELVWADEIDHWKYPETWDMAMFGLRKGPNPRAVATSTPKPTGLVRKLRKLPGVIETTGSTLENRDNLAPSFLDKIIQRYKGTRLERQEIYGEVLDSIEGALWTPDMLDRCYLSEEQLPTKKIRRGAEVIEAPDFIRTVIGVDPAVTSGEESAETGILVVAMGRDKCLYVLEDASMRGAPHQWARSVAQLYHRREADRVIGEVNNGGDLVESVLRVAAPTISYRSVRATRGKQVRAQPVAQLYEQGRVFHVGKFPVLEEQLCSWTPDSRESPDHMDALVWACWELGVGKGMSYSQIGRAAPQPRKKGKGDSVGDLLSASALLDDVEGAEAGIHGEAGADD